MRLTRSHVHAIAVSALLAGCTVGPDYRRPEVKLATGFTPAPATTASAPVDLAEWWRGFNDPVLTGLIDRALATNLDLEQAAARIDQAGAGLGLARAALLPSGDVQASYTRSRESVAAPPGVFLKGLPGGFPRDQDNFLLQTSASWEIDLFGGNRRGVEAARGQLAAAVAGAQATRVSIAGGVADAYVSARQLQAQLANVEAQLVNQRRQTALNDLLAVRGVIATADRDRSRSQLDDAETQLPRLRAALTQTANAIDVLLGDAPGTNRALFATLAPIPQGPVPAVGEPGDLLRNRPDVIAAEASLRAANARIGQSIAEFFPKLSLNGLFGFTSLTGSRFLTDDANQARATAGLRWRIFDFQRIDAEIRNARGGYREQLAAYRDGVLKAAQAQDYPLMQGIFLVITVTVLVANMLADLAYVFLDPRTREG